MSWNFQKYEMLIIETFKMRFKNKPLLYILSNDE